MSKYRFTVVCNDEDNTVIETSSRELAMKFTEDMSYTYLITMVDPRGGVSKSRGMNAWADIASIIELQGYKP